MSQTVTLETVPVTSLSVGDRFVTPRSYVETIVSIDTDGHEVRVLVEAFSREYVLDDMDAVTVIR